MYIKNVICKLSKIWPKNKGGYLKGEGSRIWLWLTYLQSEILYLSPLALIKAEKIEGAFIAPHAPTDSGN